MLSEMLQALSIHGEVYSKSELVADHHPPIATNLSTCDVLLQSYHVFKNLGTCMRRRSQRLTTLNFREPYLHFGGATLFYASCAMAAQFRVKRQDQVFLQQHQKERSTASFQAKASCSCHAIPSRQKTDARREASNHHTRPLRFWRPSVRASILQKGGARVQ